MNLICLGFDTPSLCHPLCMPPPPSMFVGIRSSSLCLSSPFFIMFIILVCLIELYLLHRLLLLLTLHTMRLHSRLVAWVGCLPLASLSFSLPLLAFFMEKVWSQARHRCNLPRKLSWPLSFMVVLCNSPPISILVPVMSFRLQIHDSLASLLVMIK